MEFRVVFHYQLRKRHSVTEVMGLNFKAAAHLYLSQKRTVHCNREGYFKIHQKAEIITCNVISFIRRGITSPESPKPFGHHGFFAIQVRIRP